MGGLGQKGIFIMSYEYVSKKEYAPARKEIEDLIKKLHLEVKKLNKEFTFEHKLIGSGSRHLITRVVGGNQGFDFDYNLILNTKKYEWNAEYAKQLIMKALNNIVKGTNFDYPENSKSAITLKVKDRKNSRIIHSVDLAIVYYPENDPDFNGYMFVWVTKNNGQSIYEWKRRSLSHNIDEKLKWLEYNVDNYWNKIREQYLYLKNIRNNQRKSSFSIYLEVVNNIYNQY